MRIRKFTDADFPAFVPFSETYLGPSHLTDEGFNKHWFRKIDGSGWNALVLEDANGDLVGACMLIVVSAKIGDKQTELAWISSTAIKDALIDSGAGAKFYVNIYRRFPLVGAMSGNEYSVPINAFMGNEIPNTSMRRFMSIHNEDAFGLCRPDTRATVTLHPIQKGSRTGLQTGLVDTIPEDYDALWSAFRETVYCCIEKDRAFLRWRYQTAPFIKYRFIEMRRDRRLVALAVLRLQETPMGNAGRILDFISDDHDEAACWSALAAEASEAGAIFSDFHIIGSRHDAALGQAGYSEAKKESGLNAIPNLLSPVDHREWTNTFHMGGKLAKADTAWRAADKVYFTKGDSDRDWPTAYDVRPRD